MAVTATRTNGARIAGLVAGLLLVAAFAWHAWRVPRSEAPLGLGVSLRAAPGGELSVDARGAVLSADSLVPGGAGSEARGLFHMRNLTGRTIAVHPRLSGGDPQLERVVYFELTRRGSVVYSGPAAGLRGTAARPVLLPTGGLAALRVRAWVPGRVATALLGRAGRWDLGLDVQAQS
jgi:hypothetical protein